MKLEDEIKQSSFKNEFIKAGINIIFTSSFLLSVQNKHFKAFGLTGPQFNILRILRGQYPKPATVNLLIGRMLDKSSNASRIVEKLRIKGLIERVQCQEDRRSVNVIITNKGLDLLQEIDKTEDAFFGNLTNISLDEAVVLNKLLDKIRGKVKHE